MTVSYDTLGWADRARLAGTGRFIHEAVALRFIFRVMRGQRFAVLS